MRFLLADSVRKIAKSLILRLKNRTPRMSACISVCLSLICTLLLPSFLSDGSIGFSNSFLSVAYAAALFALFNWYLGRNHCRRELALTHIFGFMLSCMTAMGSAVEHTGRLLPAGALLCLAVLIYTHVFACAVSLLWDRLAWLEQREHPAAGDLPESENPVVNRWIEYAMKRPWVIMLILLICWLPCFVAQLPAGFSYDMTSEFEQQNLIYNSAFPRLHSVLLIGCLNASHFIFGSYNEGIAAYAAVQMTAFSALFAHMLTTFYRKSYGKVFLVCAGAYFAFFPVIHLTVTHIGRDTLFAGLLTCLVFMLCQLVCDTKAFFASVCKPVMLGAVLSLTLLSRNNNNDLIMILLLAVVNLFVWLRSRRAFPRGITLFCVSNLSVFIVLSVILGLICQPISKTNPRASMSVFSQTLVRAYIDEPEKWTSKDKADFDYYYVTEKLKYCPEEADFTKQYLDNINSAKDLPGFMKMWLRIGFKCPRSYVNALTAQTRYMWYPDSVIDGYVRAGIYQGCGKSYFDTSVEMPGKKVNFWLEGMEFYRRIGLEISFEKIPVLSMLFSIGFQYWLILNCLFYTVYRRRKKLLLPLAAVCVYLLFCFFIPLVLMRYFMPLFLLLPLTLAMTSDNSPGTS